MSSVTDILNALPALSQVERATIRNRIAALDSLDGPPPNNTQTSYHDSSGILQAICDFMHHKGLETTYMPVLTRHPQYRAFAEKCPLVIEYLGPLSKLERDTLLFIGVGLLYSNLCEMGVVVTTRTLMSHIHRLPGCLNRAFPGYAGSGYLKLAARKKRNSYDHRTNT